MNPFITIKLKDRNARSNYESPTSCFLLGVDDDMEGLFCPIFEKGDNKRKNIEAKNQLEVRDDTIHMIS